MLSATVTMKRQWPSTCTSTDSPGRNPPNGTNGNTDADNNASKRPRAAYPAPLPSSAGTTHPAPAAAPLRNSPTWTEQQHRDFVAAIFEVGMKNSSPSAILEYMAPNDNLTVERVKSRLQKFRLKRDESKVEFMRSFDDALSRLRSEEATTAPPAHSSVQNRSAEAAAFLAYASLLEEGGRSVPAPFRHSGAPPVVWRDNDAGDKLLLSLSQGAAGAIGSEGLPMAQQQPKSNTGSGAADISGGRSNAPAIAALAEAASKGLFDVAGAGSDFSAAAAGQGNLPGLTPSMAEASTFSSLVGTSSDGAVSGRDSEGGAPLRLPQMTEEERHSPLGKSMVHMVGLFFALKDVLLRQRAEQADTNAKAEADANANANTNASNAALEADDSCSSGPFPG